MSRVLRLGYTVRVADVTVNSYSRVYSRDSSSTRLARSHSAHIARAAGMKVGSYCFCVLASVLRKCFVQFVVAKYMCGHSLYCNKSGFKNALC